MRWELGTPGASPPPLSTVATVTLVRSAGVMPLDCQESMHAGERSGIFSPKLTFASSLHERQRSMSQTISELDSVSFEEQTNKRIPQQREFGSTPRTAALRAALKWKAAVVKDFEDAITGLAKCEFRKGQFIRVDVIAPA